MSDVPKKGKRGHNEGSLHQRASDGLWVADVSLGYGPDGKRVRKRLYGKTRAEANRKLQQALRTRSDGLTVQTREQTVGQYLEHWLEHAVAPNVRPRTLESYQLVCRTHLIPSLGRHKLSALNAQHIAAYMTHKQTAGRQRSGRPSPVKTVVESKAPAKKVTGLSATTVNYHRAVLRSALNQAMRWDMLNRNVAELTQPRPAVSFEAKPLTRTEADRFLAAAQGDRLEALFSVALALGLRQGEALGLSWSDVDLDAGTLTVRWQLQQIKARATPANPTPGVVLTLVEPKTKRSRRTLPIPDELLRTLKEHRRRQLVERLVAGPRWGGKGRLVAMDPERREPWDLVFTSTIGTPLDTANITKTYRTILETAGLPLRRYHDLRHSCASFLAAKGVAQRVVMEILGHSQLSTTANIYTHVDADQLREATGRLDDLFSARTGST